MELILRNTFVAVRRNPHPSISETALAQRTLLPARWARGGFEAGSAAGARGGRPRSEFPTDLFRGQRVREESPSQTRTIQQDQV